MKNQFIDNRGKFREVMDKVRTREHETFRALDFVHDDGN